ELAGITGASRDPLGGKIARDSSGAPTGILQDAAFEKVQEAIPKPTAADNIKAAETALDALRKQGVTTFLDAAADEETLAAFKGAERNGKLTARAHFAVLVRPPQGREPRKAMTQVRELASRYDEGQITAPASMTVRNIKLFLDGVITAPACTGAMLQPYFVNAGTAQNPRWVPGKNRGPEVYFPAPVLDALLLEAAAAGFEPHMHADGDRAVHEALDAIQVLRKTYSGEAIRAAIAHDEIVDPTDFARYRQV